MGELMEYARKVVKFFQHTSLFLSFIPPTIFILSGHVLFVSLFQNLALVEFSKAIALNIAYGSLVEDGLQKLERSLAFAQFSQLVQTEETDDTNDLLAKIYIWQGNTEDAISSWKRTDYSLADLVVLPLSHQKNGYYSIALREFYTLAELFPQSSSLWYFIGGTLFDQKKYGESIIVYDKAIQLNNFEDSLVALGDVYLRKGYALRELKQAQKALESFVLAIENDNLSNEFDLATAYYKQGEMLVWMNRNREAIDPLIQSIEIDPAFYNAYSLLGVIAYRTGRLLEAEQLWQKAVEIEPNYIWPYLQAARMFRDIQQPEKAILYYQKALQINPHNKIILSELVNIRQNR